MKTVMQKLVDTMNEDQVSFTEWFQDNYLLLIEDERGNMVRLLRWVLKHYSTGVDIDGFFMWENPIGKEFDSIQIVDHYLKENNL